MAEATADFRHETARLVLRDWRAEDWPAFIHHTNTPAVMRWLGGVQDADHFRLMADRFAECRAAHGHCFWVVERRADGGSLGGELLGFCGLKRGNAPDCSFMGQFEIGWRLRQDAWGQGYAAEAARASLDLGFTRFAAPVIHAITVPGNRASWTLMERLGLRRAPALDFRDSRFTGELNEVIAYSLTRAEWESRLP
ncbi:GNAT family N-acetyltransferase [Novosphingobium aerophilum]|uniref:GNAT family N-acetyltransferase n=1 Tax=Novosphingobium aerophilum TaxID=2839843 RepID=A0A7X1F8T5_9SPHN|nr:GNAT family N-acetyltransferase [Novosphingobium aerophilum]MBC2652483.1 GNAT family N-acetyltransferase [Novosphingobium aerophilum]